MLSGRTDSGIRLGRLRLRDAGTAAACRYQTPAQLIRATSEKCESFFREKRVALSPGKLRQDNERGGRRFGETVKRSPARLLLGRSELHGEDIARDALRQRR